MLAQAVVNRRFPRPVARLSPEVRRRFAAAYDAALAAPWEPCRCWQCEMADRMLAEGRVQLGLGQGCPACGAPLVALGADYACRCPLDARMEAVRKERALWSEMEEAGR
jgi:hypothetical protein